METRSLFVWLALMIASLFAVMVWYVMRIDASSRPRWLEWFLIWPLLFRELEELNVEQQRRSRRRIVFGYALMFGLILFAVLFIDGSKN